MGFIISRYWSKSIIRCSGGRDFMAYKAYLTQNPVTFYQWYNIFSHFATILGSTLLMAQDFKALITMLIQKISCFSSWPTEARRADRGKLDSEQIKWHTIMCSIFTRQLFTSQNQNQKHFSEMQEFLVVRSSAIFGFSGS